MASRGIRSRIKVSVILIIMRVSISIIHGLGSRSPIQLIDSIEPTHFNLHLHSIIEALDK